jgi:hypothetical protein
LLTLEQAAEKLGICATTTKKLIDAGVLEAKQVVSCAPWHIAPSSLETEPVRRAVDQIRRGKPAPSQRSETNQQDLFSTP